ncbi:MAG: D-alanine--D-alanine ligase family protein, partial [Clostridia bacterium]
MSINKKNILIVFGGVSTEHEISCVSAIFALSNINTEKYNIYKMGITKDGAWFLYSGNNDKIGTGEWLNDIQNLQPAVISPCTKQHGLFIFNKQQKSYQELRIDVAFPVLHGKNGEDGTIQGLLTLAGIPFVGCSTYSSAVCMDKVTTKLLCEEAGIHTSPFVYSKKNADGDYSDLVNKSEKSFGYPVFVKPSCSGSSVGITKAKNRDELINGILFAFKHDDKILIEKAIFGKEIEVAVFGNADTFVSACGEIEPCADFYDYETKYVSDAAKYYIPARIDPDLSDLVRKAAKNVFDILDCSGLARVDFFVDKNDIILNEINTIPGFTA